VTAFSLISGFAVFGVAGYISYTSGIPVNQLPLDGTQLAFETYPVGTITLGYPWTQILNVLFFLMLLLIGISSAVSLLEPVLCSMRHSRWGKNLVRWKIVLFFCIVGFIIDLLYCFDFGVNLQNEVGIWVSSIGLMYNGLVESAAFMWVYNYEYPHSKVGARVCHIFAGVFWGGSCLFSLLAFAIPGNAGKTVGGVGILCTLIVAFCVVPFFCNPTTDNGEVLSFKDKTWWLFWATGQKTVNQINSVVGHNAPWWYFMKYTFWYTVLSRFFIPILLMVGLWDYLLSGATWSADGYSVAWVVVGALAFFVMMVGATLVGLIFPKAMDWCNSYPEDACMVVDLYPGPFELKVYESEGIPVADPEKV